jgi:hypothetical protein
MQLLQQKVEVMVHMISYKKTYDIVVRVIVVLFSSSFNNMLAIWWQSALLMAETGVIEKKTIICRKSLTTCIEYT